MNRNQIQRQAQRVDPESMGLPTRGISNPTEIKSALLQVQAVANVLAPVTEIQTIPRDYEVVLQSLVFDTTFTPEDRKARSNGRWYVVEGGKLALHKSALDQLASAAGLSIVDTHTVQVEPGLWRSKVKVEIKSFDGTCRTVQKSKELDIRDGGDPQALRRQLGTLAWNDPKKKEIRKRLALYEHGAQKCETMASNRAIRAALGIQGAYSEQDASKPFVVPKIVWAPPNDPEISRLIAAKELGVIDQLFGSRATPAPVQIDVRERIDPDELDMLDADFDDSTEDVPQPPPQPVDTCSECNRELPAPVIAYSQRHFGRLLCRDHQNAARAAASR